MIVKTIFENDVNRKRRVDYNIRIQHIHQIANTLDQKKCQNLKFLFLNLFVDDFFLFNSLIKCS